MAVGVLIVGLVTYGVIVDILDDNRRAARRLEWQVAHAERHVADAGPEFRALEKLIQVEPPGLREPLRQAVEAERSRLMRSRKFLGQRPRFDQEAATLLERIEPMLDALERENYRAEMPDPAIDPIAACNRLITLDAAFGDLRNAHDQLRGQSRRLDEYLVSLVTALEALADEARVPVSRIADELEHRMHGPLFSFSGEDYDSLRDRLHALRVDHLPTVSVKAQQDVAEQMPIIVGQDNPGEFVSEYGDGPPARDPDRKQPTPVERFGSFNAPGAVNPGQNFIVQFALTTLQMTPEAEVTSGEKTAEGALRMSLPPPANGDSWPIEVILSAPYCDIVGGVISAQLDLPRTGDSAPVMFRLVAREPPKLPLETQLRVDLWHGGTFVGRVARPFVIRGTAHEAAPTLITKKNSAAVPATATHEEPATPRVPIDLVAQPPDLTIHVHGDPEDASRRLVTVATRIHQAPTLVAWKVDELADWLGPRLTDLARGENRGVVVKQDSDRPSSSQLARLKGFGRELFGRYAPQLLRDRFWALRDKLGERFESIAIYSDDPRVPWELMRPTRPDGSDECDFLGIEFRVGRWHISDQTAVRERPPQVVEVRELVVVAPEYDGGMALPGQSTEVAGLREFPGFRPLRGRRAELATLFGALPSGIVHFAGHGFASNTQNGTARFAIQLEDGTLDLTEWRGLAPMRATENPFFFFNACDVGRTERVGTFVEGWAAAALELGASGYVSSLWPLNDAHAANFAVSFYGRLREKLNPGSVRIADVLRTTRRERLEAGDTTALSYVYYGDPNLRMTRR